MKKKLYITTTLPYVNADPHLGHALEFVHADIIARYKRMQGFDVFLNTGTDEHGLKIYQKAIEGGMDPKVYVDEYAKRFKVFVDQVGMSYTRFIRTTDEDHIRAAQAFWDKCEEMGDIYKKLYKVKYCVGCELEKTDSELVDGKCPVHPSLTIQNLEEENYFFRFSKYQEQLLELYRTNKDFVVPSERLNEIEAFVSRGLQDFSISRLKDKMPWGIDVRNDKGHVMYVWFDALVNYISAVGWPEDKSTFDSWWPVVQLAGKDNLRQQSAMWQAMLLSAGIAPSKQILIHGFILGGDGQKMSKTLGNTVDPSALIEEYGKDALRAFLAKEVSSFEDTPVSLERFKESYNANLANGIGNLSSRILTMSEKHLETTLREEDFSNFDFLKHKTYTDAFDRYDIQEASQYVWARAHALDKRIQETEPFRLIKTNEEEGRVILKELVSGLYEVAVLLSPIIPDTAEKIISAIRENKTPTQLFARK